ncbi:hypothetical protein [Streptomyces sp. NBC_01166]|uniref:hypothetical protein n=1 Tax=Streptomyces sp. NBC_01166 TaxID=2903755 RepID=UPI0038674C48
MPCRRRVRAVRRLVGEENGFQETLGPADAPVEPAVATSVPDKLGTGAPFTIMSPFWGSPPKAGCTYYKAVDAAAGTKVTWQNQEGGTYGQKLGAVLASSSMPDMMVVPRWELVGKIANAVTAKFMVLGPIWRASRPRSIRTWRRFRPTPDTRASQRRAARRAAHRLGSRRQGRLHRLR